MTCDQHQVAHKRCSKLIVATDETQQTKLQKIYRQTTDNEVVALSWLSRLAIVE